MSSTENSTCALLLDLRFKVKDKLICIILYPKHKNIMFNGNSYKFCSWSILKEGSLQSAGGKHMTQKDWTEEGEKQRQNFSLGC